MSVIAKNSTSTIVNINDISVSLPPTGSINLTLDIPKREIANSNDLVDKISSGVVIINDGINDLNPSDGIRLCSSLIGEVTIGVPTDNSGKHVVHETSRPIGTKTYFTGAGDNHSDITDIGGGNLLSIHHEIGDSLEQVEYIDFNTISNETWVHEGYVTWKDAVFDQLDFEIVTRSVNVESSVETYYNLYNGYLIVPAAADGTIEVTSDITQPDGGLVYMPISSDTGLRDSAYWNADWNTDEGKFENITPAPNGDGLFNMFATEIPLVKFANKLPLLGSGFQRLQTADADMMGHGMRMKLICRTFGEDHEWSAAMILTMFREKTI
jgi:hypothetical protein